LEHRRVAAVDVNVASPGAGAWTFERLAGAAALAVAAGGISYSIAFVIFLGDGARWSAYAQSLLLLVGGLATTVVFVALFERLRTVDAGFALWALVIGLFGAFASAVHGAYDLSILLNPPENVPGLPNGLDPRGLGTFALTGLALFVFALLALRGGGLPRRLAYLAIGAAGLLVWVYIGRLVILNPKSAGVLPFAVVLGFVVNPLLYLWLGLTLLRERS
jgi:hypothetical protein